MREPVAGGGRTNAADMMQVESYPSTSTTWVVSWKQENGADVDNIGINLWVLCVPEQQATP